MPPAAIVQLSVNTDWICCLSSNIDLPLNVDIKDCHHNMSARMPAVSFILWLSPLSKLMESMMRRRKTLPPKTTLVQKFNFPARDCNCFFEALFRVSKSESSVRTWLSLASGNLKHMLTESISTPRKLSLYMGQLLSSNLYENPVFATNWWLGSMHPDILGRSYLLWRNHQGKPPLRLDLFALTYVSPPGSSDEKHRGPF